MLGIVATTLNETEIQKVQIKKEKREKESQITNSSVGKLLSFKRNLMCMCSIVVVFFLKMIRV